MIIQWTRRALSDLVRLHNFLLPLNSIAAARVIQSLTKAPERLLEHPRMGEKLNEFNPREVRRLFIGGYYEIRYEIQKSTLFILRVWHTREKR